MTKIAATLALSSLYVLVGCVGEADDPALPAVDRGGHLPEYADDPFGPVPSFRPRTCQDIVDYIPSIGDGEYTLYIDQDPTLRWKVYCADMQSSPREYLTLPYAGDGLNMAMFAPASGGEVVTSYDKIRIEAGTGIIDIGDTTFAVSTGSAVHDRVTLTSMPYGVAMSCGATAKMNINLRGTPYRLETSFSFYGTKPETTTVFASDRKALDMTAKGTCAWVAPTERTNPTSADSQPVLRLAYFR
jgi:hypothetical protein